MPILTRSANRLAAALLALVAGTALAQDSPRDGIQRQGEPAMKRLEEAIARAKPMEGEVPDPRLPGEPAPGIQRRAFEGLRGHRVSPDIDRRAREAAAAGEAQLATQREAMARRLRQSLGLEPGDLARVAKAVAPTHAGWVPVLFVSSSMPVPILRAYAAQLERVRGVMAFRGVPGGLDKIGPMARLSADILRQDPGCEGPACAMRDVQIMVDPLVFRQHGVAKVPALAMIPGDPAQPYCEREEESPRARFIVYGDAALLGLVEEYRRIGGGAEVRDVQARLAAP